MKKANSVLRNYAGGLLKRKLIQLATDNIVEWLFSRLPFLAWGPFSVIVSFIVTKIVIRILDQTIIGAHVLYIYADTTFDRKKVEAIILKINRLGKGASIAEIKMLDKELAIASRELIRFGTL